MKHAVEHLGYFVVNGREPAKRLSFAELRA
jgi:hypothetical protein